MIKAVHLTLKNLNLSIGYTKLLAFGLFILGFSLTIPVKVATIIFLFAQSQPFFQSFFHRPQKTTPKPPKFPRMHGLFSTLLSAVQWILSILAFQKNLSQFLLYLAALCHLNASTTLPLFVAIITGCYILHHLAPLLRNNHLVSALLTTPGSSLITESSMDHLEFALESVSSLILVYLFFSPITLPPILIPLALLCTYLIDHKTHAPLASSTADYKTSPANASSPSLPSESLSPSHRAQPERIYTSEPMEENAPLLHHTSSLQ